MNDLSQPARRLREAYQKGAIQPLRDVLAPDDVTLAYEIQNENTRFWTQEGRRIVGRKIGLTSFAVQEQLGVSQPDFGVLFSDMQISNGGRLDWSKVLQPKAEAEIALILSDDLSGTEITPDQILEATRYIAPSIEIVDSRIADWKITFGDTVADNGSSAFFVLGEQASPDNFDFYTCGMVMEINDQIVSLGAGGACLGNPLNAAAWLANELARRGAPLRKDDIILTGALGPMASISPGDEVTARIGGLGDCCFTVGA